MKKVHIEQEKRVFDGFLKIDEAHLQVEQFDGTMSTTMRRLKLERGDAVAALIFHETWGEYLLVNQFRYPTYGKTDGWLTELVAGVVEEGESPETCMYREIEEEIGYAVKTLTHISTFFVSPGGSSERIFLYFARVTEQEKVNEGGGVAGEHEDIQLVRYTPPQLQQALQNGEIYDAKTIIAIQWMLGQG